MRGGLKGRDRRWNKWSWRIWAVRRIWQRGGKIRNHYQAYWSDLELFSGVLNVQTGPLDGLLANYWAENKSVNRWNLDSRIKKSNTIPENGSTWWTQWLSTADSSLVFYSASTTWGFTWSPIRLHRHFSSSKIHRCGCEVSPSTESCEETGSSPRRAEQGRRGGLKGALPELNNMTSSWLPVCFYFWKRNTEDWVLYSCILKKLYWPLSRVKHK